MANKIDDNKTLRCSFCGKSQEQVRKLIAGPNGAFICDECVDVCSEIIEDEFDEYDMADHEINLLNSRVKEKGVDPNTIQPYLDSFKYGTAPHCKHYFI